MVVAIVDGEFRGSVEECLQRPDVRHGTVLIPEPHEDILADVARMFLILDETINEFHEHGLVVEEYHLKGMDIPLGELLQVFLVVKCNIHVLALIAKGGTKIRIIFEIRKA